MMKKPISKAIKCHVRGESSVENICESMQKKNLIEREWVSFIAEEKLHFILHAEEKLVSHIL